MLFLPDFISPSNPQRWPFKLKPRHVSNALHKQRRFVIISFGPILRDPNPISRGQRVQSSSDHVRVETVGCEAFPGIGNPKTFRVSQITKPRTDGCHTSQIFSRNVCKDGQQQFRGQLKVKTRLVKVWNLPQKFHLYLIHCYAFLFSPMVFSLFTININQWIFLIRRLGAHEYKDYANFEFHSSTSGWGQINNTLQVMVQ